ncbi:MAG: DUF1616 domain-containing protein [Thermoplasmata archaeon]|jgi:hypothetical protein|nr:DUF1616 domain-containing protein [Thermoplasmata archaeon]
MTATSVVESVAGLLLLFFFPGYTTTRAVFPEWRIRGAEAWRRGVEVVTLSFVLSVGWTIVIGYLLLAVAPSGFGPFWTNPELEVALLFVTLVSFISGWRVGAYDTHPPPTEVPAPDPGGEGAWELTRRLDRLAREERRVEHALRVADPSGTEVGPLRLRLEALREESSRLRRDREISYAE